MTDMAEKAGKNTGGLVKQPHGGAIHQGAPSVLNGGRPASQLRERLRGSLSDRIPIIEQIADTGELPSDRLKAIDLMAKYGLGANKGHDEALVAQLARVTAEVFQDDPRLAELHERWVKVIGAHIRGDDA